MYIQPQPHLCPKCGFECDYSPSDPHPAPQLADFIGCPSCWKGFLDENVGNMARHPDKTIYRVNLNDIKLPNFKMQELED